MAVTDIHPITATVHKAIAYICNPEKTDGRLLVSSFGCAPETAHYDYAFTRQNAAIQSPNLAHHLIQAFKPGEVTPEEAHEIGQELADSLLKGKYSYVLTTHIDKGHVHNHLIFNAVDNEEYQHYNDCKKSYYHIRCLSDGLCRDHGLSVIKEPSGKRGMSWWEWRVTQDGDSQKVQLKRDINKCIQITDSFEEFLEFMKAKGYQIKMGKYISFGLPGSDRFIRGKESILGKQYTKEQILKRIENKPKISSRIQIVRLKYLLEMPPEVLHNSENTGLKNWATKENLKRMTESYNRMIESGVHSIEELDAKAEQVKQQKKELRSSFKGMEQQQRDLKETRKYLQQYIDTKEVYKQYQNAYFRDRYFREHESEIIIYGAATNYFKDRGLNPDKLTAGYVTEQMAVLEGSKQDIKKQIRKIDGQSKELQMMKENLQQYLDIADKPMNPTKEIEKQVR